MRTNTLLTYLLYALLFGLIFSAGYMAYKTRQEKLQQVQNDQDINQTLRDLGYSPSDSAAATGSTYAGGSDTNTPERTGSSSTPASVPSRDGIEDEPAAPAPAAQKPTVKQPAATPAKSAPAPAPAKTSTAKGVSGSATPSKNLNTDARGGRYQVRAGSFGVMENARDLLEKVIKMGYQQAEIGKLNGGKYATVVILRTNDRAKAIKVMDQLEAKGIDAFVYDAQRK